MSLFLRNLARRGIDITIEDRDSKIINGQVSEVFTNPTVVKALIKTISGVSVFDSTNTERVATHKMCLIYNASITAEKWIKLGTKRIKILTAENYCEQGEQLILMCTERGEDSKVVNGA